MGFLHGLYAGAAAAGGELLAIDGSQGRMTYAEILERADRISARLARAGAGAGARIGVADSLGVDLYPVVLAVSALDCSIASFVEDGNSNEVRRLERLGVRATIVGGEPGMVEVTRLATALDAVRLADECYVLSTSGSTSAPKDVAISDRNVESYAAHLRACARVQPGDRISQNYKPHFDAFYEVLLMAVLGHGTIVVPDGRENVLVERFCNRWGVTVWNSVPSQVTMAFRLRQLTPGSLPDVKLAVFGGESLSSQCLSLWRQAAPASIVVNSYGPAESTIAIAEYVMPTDLAVGDGDVPIGTVLPHMEHCLVEPEGAPGELELCVRGPQVFGGYLDCGHDVGRFYLEDSGEHRLRTEGRPDLDDWYRTGDIVSEGPDGLVFRRRLNQEVKVRGKRVDLAAVEAELRRHSGVSDARAIVLDDAVHAIVEAAEPDVRDKPIDVRGLRDYARPHTVVWVGSLPRLANGKSDIRAMEQLLRRGRREWTSAVTGAAQADEWHRYGAGEHGH